LPTATTELVRALRLLARRPDGCPEAIMLAEGFKIAFLAGLVRNGLVTAELTPARVVWVQITELGREAHPLTVRCPRVTRRNIAHRLLARRKPKLGQQQLLDHFAGEC
jgi:hypothetical protein